MHERQLMLPKNTKYYYLGIPKILENKPIFLIFLLLLFGIASVSHQSFNILSAPKQGEKISL